MARNKPVLLCTVGGAHQPILEAIRFADPEYVCFFCTNKTSTSPGSVVNITGAGNVIHAQSKETAAVARIQTASDMLRDGDAQGAQDELNKKDKPTLPNLPALAMLGQGRFGHVAVPADDLDEAVRTMRGEATKLLAKYPSRPFIANYTGGTKTMTAALVCVALEFDEVELQIVSGPHNDLGTVKDGTEQTVAASVSALRLHRAMTPYQRAWLRFAYQEAADGLHNVSATVNTPGYELLLPSRILSEALTRWDRFDHQKAGDLLKTYGSIVSKQYPHLLRMVQSLTQDGPQREPARLFDVWLNAERCAKQGRYDDAVARWYRMVEWTAQWQIKEQLGFATNDFPRDELPEGMRGKTNGEGAIKVGLSDAWKIIAAKCNGACREFAEREASSLRSHLDKRNQSILAHGFRPVSQTDWQELDQWTRERFLPMLREHAKKSGLREEPSQLPTEPPEM